MMRKKSLECRKCGCCHFVVVYTRHRDGYIMRKRACRHCGKFILTREHEVGSKTK